MYHLCILAIVIKYVICSNINNYLYLPISAKVTSKNICAQLNLNQKTHVILDKLLHGKEMV